MSCGFGIAYFREFEVQLPASWCNLVQPTASSCNSARRARTQPVDKWGWGNVSCPNGVKRCEKMWKIPGDVLRQLLRKKTFWSDFIRISQIYSEMVRIGQTEFWQSAGLKASIRNYPKLAAITRNQMQLPETNFWWVPGSFYQEVTGCDKMWLELRVAKKNS